MDAPCLCGSGRPFDLCCGPVISGTVQAPTAEALMRARYSAFARGNVSFLVETLASDIRGDFDATAAADTVGETEWLGLEIKKTEGGEPDDREGLVEFVARFKLQGQQRIHHELSRFVREGERWVCAGGEMNPKEPPRHVEKVGRNDPCPCGSGKKYKKCCGA